MDFCNLELWLFVFLALLLNAIACKFPMHPEKVPTIQKLLIATLSLFLLGYVSIISLCVFVYVIISGYVGCKALKKTNGLCRKLSLPAMIICLVSPLLYYKYGNFILETLSPSSNFNKLKDIIIPVGISFYTFQIVGYCIDTLKRNANQPMFLDYLNFCAFFPQIVAGPIERKEELLPQIRTISLRNTPTKRYQGISYIIIGLFFKACMADNAEMIARSIIETKTAWYIWTQNLLFGLRIYFDFAGYGLAAFGLALCLGIKLQMNFWSPYTAPNITEYWRRWHISLTGWFRDYIYFPLGGSRTRFWALNILIVFLISGFWHGAGWNFIVWGGLAGAGMVAHRLYRKLGGHMPALAGWALSMIWAMFAWMFFYERDWGTLADKVHTLASISSYVKYNPFKVLSSTVSDGYTFTIFLCFSSLVILLEHMGLKQKDNPYHYLLNLPVLCLMIMLTIIFNPGTSNQFIYFSF